MVGLTDDQIEELKLKDEWSDRSYPSGGSVFNADGVGRRTGNGSLRVVFGEVVALIATK